MNIELKPCPFCGGSAKEITRFDIGCEACGYFLNNLPNLIREQWNTRITANTEGEQKEQEG